MSTARGVIALPLVAVAVAVLGLAGCRGGAERAALPAPAVSGPSGVPGSPAGPAATDPLAGVEATVDAIEHDVDSDADSDPGRGR